MLKDQLKVVKLNNPKNKRAVSNRPSIKLKSKTGKNEIT